jgi:DNA-binding MarR family transcriptional regulator
MESQQLSEDLIQIMKVLVEVGGTDCTGTCHHRKPGEFHCHTLGKMLGISSQGVKNRILSLIRMGLLERIRVEREDSTLLVRFVPTDEGKAVVANHENGAA